MTVSLVTVLDIPVSTRDHGVDLSDPPFMLPADYDARLSVQPRKSDFEADA